LSPVSVPDIFKVTKHLELTKSVGHNNIPTFVIMDCYDVLVPGLNHIFNLVCQQYFPTVRKQVDPS
jgi:hypothetical protein